LNVLEVIESMQFTVPLPFAALGIFILGGIYTLWKFHKISKAINSTKNSAIHQSYCNVFLREAEGYFPSYPPLDPAREMEALAKNWVVHLYSRKNANLIYARILDCIGAHRFMLHSMKTNKQLCECEHFNIGYLNNSMLYFFLIEILQLKNSERINKFQMFSDRNEYLYDRYNGHFKELTTLSYKPKI
jgi:hypothetical protein